MKADAPPSLTKRPSYHYAVDQRDRIVAVSPEWLAFAVENDAPELTEAAVMGRSLWSFIADEGTRHLYDLMFRRARESGRPLTVPFRCDSPRLKRFMELTMAPAPSGGIELTGRLIRLEPQEGGVLLSPGAARTDQMIHICGWCKRILLETGEWQEIADMVSARGMFASFPVPAPSHGICPTCGAGLERELDALA